MEIKHSINYFLRKDWKIRIIEILPFLIMDAFYLRLYFGNRKMLLTYGDTYTLTAGDCLRPALSAVYLVFALMIALSFFAFYRFQTVGMRDFIKFYSEKKVYLTIDITDTNQSEYLFTLYHTYKLEGITDQNGDALEYSRFDDYIRISSHAPVSQFVFQYSGSAPGACTNSEGIHLSSYFPFYPMQGIQAVYYSYTDSYLDHQMSDKTPFYVHVDSTKQVYCNLPEVSHNTFAGTETGFFLLSGFVETYKYKDITVLYPYNGKTSTSYDEWNRAIDSFLELEQEYDSDHSNHIQYIMIERGFSASRLYTYGSNYAEVAALTTTHMMQIDGYSVPDEPEGYALYKHYLETGRNEINSYFYN